MNLNKDNETTSYLVKDIPKKSWNKFRGYALIMGHNSVGDLLRDIIENWKEGSETAVTDND